MSDKTQNPHFGRLDTALDRGADLMLAGVEAESGLSGLAEKTRPFVREGIRRLGIPERPLLDEETGGLLEAIVGWMK